MIGTRIDISKHVVNNILNTLSIHDYVNVITFNDDTQYLVNCLRDLVEATPDNIHQLKLGLVVSKFIYLSLNKYLIEQKLFQELDKDSLGNKTNIHVALNFAFDILEEFRFTHRGACCNQAIMLITDGLPYDVQDIFERRNWRNKPDIPVRLFTYLIGEEQEIPEEDIIEVKLIACNNQGYYVHIDTPTEAREHVLKYMSVMARPLVLNQNTHPISWTNIYADALVS
jgi:voltage-dependent calcium channel alpha-2/delta-3